MIHTTRQFLPLLAFAALLLSSTCAFSPHQRMARTPTSITILRSSTSEESTTATPSSINNNDDAFASYSMNNPEQGLAYRDTVVGTGNTAEKGKVLVVAYKGRLLKSGKQFDEGTGYAFRLGEGKVIRGWDRGLVGMKVGGKRTLRIPPNLAYGDEGFTFLVPARAHLEFDCELTSVASNQFEEVFALAYAQKERLITVILLLILLAVSPQFG